MRSCAAPSATSALRPRRVRLGLVLVGLLTLAACSSDTGSEGTTQPSASPTSSPATSAPDTSAPPGGGDDSTTSSTTTSSTTTSSTVPALPGEPIEFGPAAGDILAVVGVTHDDVLNLRAAPGTDQNILVGLTPMETAITALGHTRQLPNSVWFEVEFEETVGWVSHLFVAHLGDTHDLTSEVVAALGEIPEVATMEELIDEVTSVYTQDEPIPRVTMITEPVHGDLSEVYVDLTGFGDDSQYGWRMHIFAEPTDGGFGLKSIEATLLCRRGVTEGLCR